jgi:hypothetical protein
MVTSRMLNRFYRDRARASRRVHLTLERGESRLVLSPTLPLPPPRAAAAVVQFHPPQPSVEQGPSLHPPNPCTSQVLSLHPPGPCISSGAQFAPA